MNTIKIHCYVVFIIFSITVQIESQIHEKTSQYGPYSTNNKTNLKWKQNAITVAGGNDEGKKLNQLYGPHGIFIDKNKNIFIADSWNNRIIEWKYNAKEGQIIVGGKGMDQLNEPTDVIVDQQNHSIIIADKGNRRVIQWLNQNQQILIDSIDCWGLAIDKNGFLYVSDHKKNEVRRWKMGEYNNEGIIVAGGNKKGDQLNQFNSPTFIFVDEDQSVYVSDENNLRVMKWGKDAKEGTIVAGGNGYGRDLNQLSSPQGVIVDHLGQIYVADYWNDRIMRWCEGKQDGEIVVDGYEQKNQTNQLVFSSGLSFDDEGNLYVADHFNHRIQKFEVIFLSIKIKESQGEVCSTATWSKHGITVAGGKGFGRKLDELADPYGIFLDDNDAIYIADRSNHRVVMWKQNATIGQWIAGLKEDEDDTHALPLNMPQDIVVDKNGTVYISDGGNYRVVRWYQNEQKGEVLIDHIQAVGIAQDNQGFIYVSEYANGQITRWNFNDDDELSGEIVAKNLGHTNFIFIDQNGSVYSAGILKDRILKIIEGNDEPILITAQYDSSEHRFDQLSRPSGVFVDAQETVYVADTQNHRIMRWLQGATNGTLIVGGNGKGSASDQLDYPSDLFLDRQGNLYVTDTLNNRVQKFLIDESSCQKN
ncbi:unnamed protein product [Adineta steineri]|uniref:Uncharacterized protein n=1 Tax=Adineta steineri TaxID=433720 RepID=A0A815WQF8_9BILA|nr:unnamed protein product [Adineta steineri]CAF1547616.1 unnamed protein product [Adineta steineri]